MSQFIEDRVVSQFRLGLGRKGKESFEFTMCIGDVK